MFWTGFEAGRLVEWKLIIASASIPYTKVWTIPIANILSPQKRDAQYTRASYWLLIAILHFLQTGKHSGTSLEKKMALSSSLWCFNSLWTGKHMWTPWCRPALLFPWVSIPYKRESTCEHEYFKKGDQMLTEGFNSLQTGKHMWTCIWSSLNKDNGNLFQFPTNGKAHVNEMVVFESGMFEIEFQFPTNGKAQRNQKAGSMICRWQIYGFNSLQTGKHIWTSPDNPKRVTGRVSIPYKRESTSELRSMKGTKDGPKCFNSLQTGKHIWTVEYPSQVDVNAVSIPYKRESTSEQRFLTNALSKRTSFNSLQTGKHIWTITIL